MPALRTPLALTVLALAATAWAQAAPPAPAGLLGPARVTAVQPRAATDEPLEAMKRFTPAEGFTVELFAAEPLLAHPAAISLDGAGRVFVAETHRARTSALDVRDYPALLADDRGSRTIEDRLALTKKHFPADWQKLGVETEIIRVLEDRDRDGKADFSAIHAAGFNSVLDGAAGGVLARGGSVWFGNIPSLWRLDGSDQDGRAEKRTELLRGFGVRFGLEGHDLRGLILGPDGRLYFACGDRGTNVQPRAGAVVALPEEGAVFRCEPDGSRFEVFCRGLRDPRDLVFDKYGNLFTADSGSGQGDKARWLHLVEGGDYGWRIGWQDHPLGAARNPWLAEKRWMPPTEGQAAWALPAVANIPDGPAGIASNPGIGLSHQYDGHFFVCATGGISTWISRRYLATFRNDDEAVFLAHCAATDATFGPDGKLYISALATGPAARGSGRIYRMFDPAEHRNAQIEATRLLLAEDFKTKAPVELGLLLGHLDQRVRLEATWSLGAQPDGERELVDVATAGSKDAADPHLARIHAVWGLGIAARRAEYQTPGAAAKMLAPLLPLLEDEDVEVRAQAVRVLGENRVTEAYEGLMRALRSEVDHVSFFSAQGLAKLGRKECVSQVLLMARTNSDHGAVLRHGYVQALAAAGDFPAIAEAAGHVDPAVRLVALLAMRLAGRVEIAQFLADEDPLLCAEAARAIDEAPISVALPKLAALLAKPRADEPLMLRVLQAAFRVGTAAEAQALGAYAAQAGQPEALRTEAVQLLARWPQPPARDRVTGLVRPLPARDAAPAAVALRALAEKQDLPENLRKAVTEAVAGLKP
jgi:quinoprotein glucose dehydrogenase